MRYDAAWPTNERVLNMTTAEAPGAILASADKAIE